MCFHLSRRYIRYLKLAEIVAGTGKSLAMDSESRMRCILGYSRPVAAQHLLRYCTRIEETGECKTTFNCASERLGWA
jgi:hypothetical protein